jgi:hypothetical protein
MSSARGVPTDAELAAALGALLKDDVLPELSGRLQFQVRVAAGVAGQLARSAALGPAFAAAHDARLASLGVESDASLISAIADGSFDDRFAELVGALRASAVERLAIVNPRHLLPEDQNLS